jgi:hypothetical protein
MLTALVSVVLAASPVLEAQEASTSPACRAWFNSKLRPWKDYPFVNSLACLVGKEADFLGGYDLILRSDADVFLTPGWNTFYPRHYSVGKGRFVNDRETKRNLKRIASRFGLTHRGIHNVGSTHYGPAPLVRDVCRLSVELSSHILTEEFAASDGKWPGWYRGVTSLYASEIAVNHLVRRFDVLPGKLDFPSTSSRNPDRHPHVHCWHTRRTFSKFEFAEGRYDGVDPDSLNLKKTRDYCLYLSLKARRELPGLGQGPLVGGGPTAGPPGKTPGRTFSWIHGSSPGAR